MKITPARLGIRIAVVSAAAGIALALGGCVQSTGPLPGSRPTGSTTPSASGAPSASASSTPAPTPTPSTSSGATAPKFTEDCNILFTPAQVYAYNPNFVADSTYAPKAGTIPAEIASDSGQTCGWVNESSGSVIEVAIATPLAADLAAAKNAASGGTPISANGEHGFFAVRNGVGTAQFFFGSLWLDVSSGDFTAVADAQSVYSVVIQNQLHAGG